MKKLFLLAVSLFSMTAYSQNPIYLSYGHVEIDFEDTSQYKYILMDTTVWDSKIPEKNKLTNNSNAIVTGKSFYYENNLKASFQFKIIFKEADSYELRFHHKYDFEKNKDGGIIETSYDNGIAWQNILFDTLLHPFVLDGFNNFYNESDTLASYDQQPGYTGLQSEEIISSYHFKIDDQLKDQTMLLRFTISSDDNNSSNEGWMIDNFLLIGYMSDYVETQEEFLPLKIFPNPSTKTITVELGETESKNLTYKIYDATGRLILNGAIKTKSFNIELETEGIYYLVITDGINSFSDKLVYLK